MFGYFQDDDEQEEYYRNLRNWARRKLGDALSDDDTLGDEDDEDNYRPR